MGSNTSKPIELPVVENTLLTKEEDSTKASGLDTIITVSHGKLEAKTEINKKGQLRNVYTKNDSIIDEKSYLKYRDESSSERIHACNPCWLKYYDKDYDLIMEGVFYQDCAFGSVRHYYKNGSLRSLSSYLEYSDSTNLTIDCSVREGLTILYDMKGNISDSIIYNRGKRVR